MFRDTEKALRQLEEELLEEDVPETEEEMIDNIAGLIDNVQNPPVSPSVYNADRTDEDPEKLSRAVLRPRKENLTGLIATSLLLSAAILAMLTWWVIHLTG